MKKRIGQQYLEAYLADSPTIGALIKEALEQGIKEAKVQTEQEWLGNTKDEPEIIIKNIHNQKNDRQFIRFNRGYIYEFDVTYQGKTREFVWNTERLWTLKEIEKQFRKYYNS